MPFTNRITKRTHGPAGNVLVVEGGIPGWKDALEQAKAEHRARQERLQEQGRASRGRFVRRVRGDDEESTGTRITVCLGGLPDWRHTDERQSEARTEYERARAAAGALGGEYLQLIAQAERDVEQQSENGNGNG